MSAITEVKVPDIGDFHDVPVIAVFVKPDDKVAKDQTLITLESDKATLDIPSPLAGTVSDVKVNVGDRVSEGSVILTFDAEGAAQAPPADESEAADADEETGFRLWVWPEHRIREARLIVASPERVLAELEKYSQGPRDEALEKSLLAREEPLIDLGLARHAADKRTIAALFQKSYARPADRLQERQSPVRSRISGR